MSWLELKVKLGIMLFSAPVINIDLLYCIPEKWDPEL